MSEPQNPTNVNESVAEPTASIIPIGATAEFKPAAPPAERSMSSNIVVPGYRMLGILGRGGMGVVYKAVQEKADRLVALKMILAGAHADQHDRTRFHVEAAAAARMSHPSIVQLYEVGETPDGFPFFSLEFVSGGTLAERLKQGPLRPLEAAALVESLARAMQYAHERGIVHRDLKPLNILLEGPRSQEAGGKGQGAGGDDKKETMIKDAGARTINRPDLVTTRSGSSMTFDARALTPKISDFGLAKQLDTEDGLTRTGAIMGSPSYMAPEQAFEQSKNVGPAADIYALGAILYECLTGRPPFKGATIADTLEQVRTMEPITLKAFAKEIPRDLETICLHCLHKEPHKRYASAEALADDLRRYQEHKPILVRPVSNLERTWRWCKRNPGWAAMIAVVVISLLGATGASTYAYFEVSAKNETLKEEVAERTKQTKIANEKTVLAEARGEQSLKAVGLFATDARVFCEDAMVPGQSRARLYGVLIKQLEAQAEQAAGEATIDALRNKAFMYQTLCNVTLDNNDTKKCREWFEKGIATVDEWDKVRAGDPLARSFRATLLTLFARSLRVEKKFDEIRRLNTEALAIRQELVGDPDVNLPAKVESITKLADSLDSLDRFEESVKLRQKVLALFIPEEKKFAATDRRYREARERSFPYRDALCETYFKAGLEATDYAKRKGYLVEADKLSAELLRDRSTSRTVRLRSAVVSRIFGELEYNHGKLAERDGKLNEADEYFAQARIHYEKLKVHSEKLATSKEMVDGLRDYSRSYYTLGLVLQRNKFYAQAREQFKVSRDIRLQVKRDYRDHEASSHMELDLIFSQLALGELNDTMKSVENMIIFTLMSEPDACYRLACVYALAINTITETRSPDPLTTGDKQLQNRYRNEAFRCLAVAHDGGFSDFFQSNIDADLDTLRDDPRMKEFEAAHHYRLGVLAKTKAGDAKKARAEFEKSQALSQEWLTKLKKDSRESLVKCVWLCAHVQLGQHADAIKFADEMRPKLGSDRKSIFALARVYALASVAADDPKQKEELRSKAISALEDAADKERRAMLVTEEDLDPIRDHPRYEEILRRYSR